MLSVGQMEQDVRIRIAKAAHLMPRIVKIPKTAALRIISPDARTLAEEIKGAVEEMKEEIPDADDIIGCQ